MKNKQLKKSKNLVKKNKDKVCYLAHPLMSTIGQSKNYKDESYIAKELKKDGFLSLVRPLKIIPPSYNDIDASNIWIHLLEICDVLILSPDWELSTGCKAEKKIAELLGIKILYLKKYKKNKKTKIMLNEVL